MKEFFERYGFLVLGIVFLIGFLIVISPLGPIIGNAAKNLYMNIAHSDVVESWSTKEEILVERSEESPDRFTVKITSSKDSDKWEAYYRYKDISNLWSDYELIGELSTDSTEHTGTVTIKRVEEGVSLQFKATKTNVTKPYTIETEIINY